MSEIVFDDHVKDVKLYPGFTVSPYMVREVKETPGYVVTEEDFHKFICSLSFEETVFYFHHPYMTRYVLKTFVLNRKVLTIGNYNCIQQHFPNDADIFTDIIEAVIKYLLPTLKAPSPESTQTLFGFYHWLFRAQFSERLILPICDWFNEQFVDTNFAMNNGMNFMMYSLMFQKNVPDSYKQFWVQQSLDALVQTMCKVSVNGHDYMLNKNPGFVSESIMRWENMPTNILINMYAKVMNLEPNTDLHLWKKNNRELWKQCLTELLDSQYDTESFKGLPLEWVEALAFTEVLPGVK